MRILAVVFCLLLVACNEDGRDTPPPLAMTEEALGFYCQMNVLEHEGPKGQIHLAGLPMPIWFAAIAMLVVEAIVISIERAA